MTLIEKVKAARRCGTPLICIRTADPAMTMRAIIASLNGTAPPIVYWDIVTGLREMNESGNAALSGCARGGITIPPVAALESALRLPDQSIAFFANMHRIIGEVGVSQAIWNLRDHFKATRRTLIMLCPTLDLPVEIAQDVLMIDEPLPTPAQLSKIVVDVFDSAKMAKPAEDDIQKAIDAICGLAAFPAEQALAMSLTKQGLNYDELWERKRDMVEQTPGLTVWRGGESFDDIGGCGNAKQFLQSILAGNEPPRAIVFIDEIEKQFAGNGSDLSGVSTEMIGSKLTWMQDKNANGCIFIGPPGAAKSALAKATGNSAGIPTIQFDLGAMKGSLVGESNQRMRQALKVVEAVSQGRAMFIATCNSIGVLPPELRRRYTFGTFFFDLPTAEERNLIWRIYVKKFGSGVAFDGYVIPNDEGWTGAEIKQCANIAWRLKVPLTEAAKYIVPVSKSAAEQIEKLRQQASGKFISASHPGIYQMPKQGELARRIEV